MSNIARMMQQATAGAGGAGLDVDEVFSTYLYDGTGSAQTITNGIDHTAENTLVWTKTRSSNQYGHRLIDEGNSLILSSDVTNGALNGNLSVSQYYLAGQSNGFRLLSAEFNVSGQEYVSWTFRKAPKFFDVIDHTQTGSEPSTVTLNHNLGCDVGMIIAKVYSHTNAWVVWHKDLGSNYAMDFSTGAKSYFGGTGISTSSTQITIPGSWVHAGYDSQNTIIYVFAHNNNDGEFGPDGDQDIIKCGSYTGNGSTDGPEINLGFEPQWVLVKNVTTGNTNWILLDNMRGFPSPSSSSTTATLFPNLTNVEAFGTRFFPTATGFKVDNTGSWVNKSGNTYIYMAIRRGPLAAPESATDVFDVVSYTADNTDGRVIATNNRVDTVFARNRNNTSERGFNVGDRLRGLDFLSTAVNYDEGGDSDSFMGFDHMKGFEVGNDGTRRLNYSNYTQIAYSWTKSPNFFDNVAYTGTGSAQNITHNLGVTPEFYIVKRRDSTGSWYAYHKSIDKDGDGLPETDAIQFNGNNAAFDSASYWNDTAPTATTFTVGTTSGVNASGGTYIAYLFASLDGIAKVGGYTGNGTSQTINCGFAPRFVFLTKWGPVGGGNKLVWDTERGIVAGNDPFLDLRSTAAENSSYDFIDPDSNGFVISGTSGWVNASGSGYMFYAIA